MSLAQTALYVLLGLLLLIGTLAPMWIWGAVIISPIDKPQRRFPWQVWAASALISFASITLAAWGLSQNSDDEARHCAPGTHYVQQDRLIGKTIRHDWICAPD